MNAPNASHGCPACGRQLRPGARFCPGCGQPVASDRPTAGVLPDAGGAQDCPSCGRSLRAGARFCPGCGKAAGSSARPPRRLLIAGVVVAVASVVALGAWRLAERDNGPAKQDGGVSAAAGYRPAQTLTHASGAQVNVPGGQVADSVKITWETMETPAALADLSLTAPVLKFESLDSATLAEKAAVDLPAGDTPANAVVLVRTSLGLWAPLPATPVTLANGKPGLRVTVDREPSPWVFAVAANPALAALPADPLMAEIIRAERLLWTDKAALVVPKRQSIALSHSGALTVSGSFQSQEQTLRNMLLSAYQNLRLRVSKDYHDEALRQEWRKAGRSPEAIAWSDYDAGLRTLRELRRQPRTALEGVTIVPDPVRGMVPDDLYGVTVLTATERLLAEYAPWGLDFVLGLIDSSAIKAPHEGLFDLRVLERVGDLKFADIKVPANAVPGLERSGWLAREKANYQSEPYMVLTLRLFASRTVNLDWWTWFLEMSDEYVLRWGPALYGAAQYIATAGATGVTGGALVLAGLTWALVETAYDMHLPANDADGTAYIRANYETVAAGEGTGVALDALVLSQKGKLTAGPLTFTATEADLRGSVAKLLLSAALAYALEKADTGYLKEIRSIPDGGRQGYNGTKLPPVLLLAFLSGMDKGNDAGQYTRIRNGSLGWYVDYDRLYAKNLSDTIGAAVSETELAKDAPSTLPYRRYREDRNWPSFIYDTMPDEQFIRFHLPFPVLEQAKAVHNIPVEQDWKKVPLDDLKLTARLRSRDGKVDVELPLADVTQQDDISKAQSRAVAVRMHVKTPIAPPEFAAVPKGYKAESKKVDTLRMRYTLQLMTQPPSGQPQPFGAPLEVVFGDQAERRAGVFNFFDAKVEHGWHMLQAGAIQLQTPWFGGRISDGSSIGQPDPIIVAKRQVYLNNQSNIVILEMLVYEFACAGKDGSPIQQQDEVWGESSPWDANGNFTIKPKNPVFKWTVTGRLLERGRVVELTINYGASDNGLLACPAGSVSYRLDHILEETPYIPPPTPVKRP